MGLETNNAKYSDNMLITVITLVRLGYNNIEVGDIVNLQASVVDSLYYEYSHKYRVDPLFFTGDNSNVGITKDRYDHHNIENPRIVSEFNEWDC